MADFKPLTPLGRPVDPEVNITYSSSVVAVAVDSGGSGSCWKSKSLSKSSSWSFLPRQAFSTCSTVSRPQSTPEIFASDIRKAKRSEDVPRPQESMGCRGT